MTRLAAIDTGTNSTRLLIAEAAPGGLREIVRETTVTRLGEGVDQSGRLAAAAKERVTECVAGYAAVIGELSVDRVLVVATSSVRDAADGESFLAEMSAGFSFDHLVLSGTEEAYLAFSGAVMGMEPGKKRMLFDVGGGSTEVVTGIDAEISFSVSMDMGCVRIWERFMPGDQPTPAELQSAGRYVDSQLAKHVSPEAYSGNDQTLGVAGTVTALAAIDLGLAAYDRELVHGHILSIKNIRRISSTLTGMSAAQRAEMYCLEPGRADVIIAGALIVERLLTFCGLEELTVSEHDILDGIALAMSQERL